MKVGSIVECVLPITTNTTSFPILVQLGDRHMIRATGEKDGVLYLAFEGLPKGVGFTAFAFREIEFPPSLEKEIAESLTREFQL